MATFLNGAPARPNLAGEYRLLYDENGEVYGAYPADEDQLDCGCEVVCDTAHDDDSPDEPDEDDDDGSTDPSHATDGARLPLRCGTCWYRRTVSVGNRTVAKCFAEGSNPTDLDRHAGGFPRLTHSEASDVRSWWPACTEYSGGDNGTSDDAARWIPQAVSV